MAEQGRTQAFGPSLNALGASGREFGPHAKPADPGQASKTVKNPSGKTVTMVFPREVVLTTDSYKRIHWPAGVHQVPEELANHPYLEKSGVKRHQVDAAKLPEVPEGDQEEAEGETVQDGPEAGQSSGRGGKKR